MQSKILIKNACVLTMEKEEILKDQNIYILNNKIFHVGKEIQNFNPTYVIDAKKNLVMPGLINTHTHVAMTLLRNYVDDVNLEDWLFNYVFPIEDELTQKDIYYGALVGILEMIASGTTTFLDMYFFEDMAAKAAQKLKMRAFLGYGIAKNDLEARIIKTSNFFAKYEKNKLINPIVAPHAIYTNNDKSLQIAKELQEKFDALLTIHLNESRSEVENSLKEHNLTPVQKVDQFNLVNSKSIVAHAVHLNAKDIQTIKKNDATLVHNPISNLKLNSGIMDLLNLQNEGINITLGTDGAASNNTLDMFETIKIASLLSKYKNNTPIGIKAFDILKMATVNAAKALQMENELGKIQKGFLADLIIVDINNPAHKPQNNIINSLVYSTSKGDVLTTIVNGKVLYEDRKFKIIEQEQIEKILNQVEKIIKRVSKKIQKN